MPPGAASLGGFRAAEMARQRSRVCTYVLGMQARAERVQTCSVPTRMPGGAHSCSAVHACARTCLAVHVCAECVLGVHAHAWQSTRSLSAHTRARRCTRMLNSAHTHPQQRAWGCAHMLSAHTRVLHMHTCVHMFVHACAYVCVHVCAYMPVCVHACPCVFMHVYMHVRMCAYMPVCVHACLCVCMHVCMCTCMSVCVHTCL